MALAALDLLAAIVTALFSAYRGALDLPWEGGPTKPTRKRSATYP
jgi:hypothetical protein